MSLTLDFLIFKNGEAGKNHKGFPQVKRAFSKLKVYPSVSFSSGAMFILKLDGSEKVENGPTDKQSAMFPAGHEQYSEQDIEKATLVSPQITNPPPTSIPPF